MHSILLALCCAIGGNVHAVSGAPLIGAHVSIDGPAHQQTTTDAHGDFSFSTSPGEYQLEARVNGYDSVRVAVTADRDVNVQVALEPLDSPKLRTIGRVTVDGRLTPIQGTIPSVDITRAEFDAMGDDRIIDGLQMLPGATFTRPDGGAASAIAVVSLRGPDPSESLVALDGQLLNDGNTGDLDLSRFPVAAISSVNVTEGLGPEDSNGSNTFGGAINMVSLRPTVGPHSAYSLSGGSFGQSEAWYNATGTQGRLGYAFAIDDQNESGYVNQTVQLYQQTGALTPTNTATPAPPVSTNLGSSVMSHLGLGTLTWSFSQNADVNARVFLLGDNRDQSGAVNGIDETPGDQTFGDVIGAGNQSFAQTIRAYQLRGRTPLGSGELTSDISESDDSIGLSGNASNPAYDVTHVDHRYNGGLAWQRSFSTAQFTIGGYTRYESLDFLAPPSGNLNAGAPPLGASALEPVLGQQINVMYARGGFQPTANLRLDGGLFESRYSSFGSNLDGRFGAIYNTDPKTAIRFSLGTGFRAPLLFERYQFPYDQLALDTNNVFVGQGSPNEHPEHATEYELGISRELSTTSTFDFSLYQTNLRDPIEIFYPLAAVDAGACQDNGYANNTNPAIHPIAACVSYQSNVGNAVYQGAEVRFVQRFVPAHLFLTATYGLNVAYPKDLNAQFSNPTSGGSLVDNAQFLGIPQQQGSIELDYRENTWHAGTSAVFRGNNNELNLPPFTLVNAVVGKQLNKHVDLTLTATNIFSAASGRYTLIGAGTPYRGLAGDDASGNPTYGPLATNAQYIEPIGFRLALTVRN